MLETIQLVSSDVEDKILARMRAIALNEDPAVAIFSEEVHPFTENFVGSNCLKFPNLLAIDLEKLELTVSECKSKTQSSREDIVFFSSVKNDLIPYDAVY